MGKGDPEDDGEMKKYGKLISFFSYQAYKKVTSLYKNSYKFISFFNADEETILSINLI